MGGANASRRLRGAHASEEADRSSSYPKLPMRSSLGIERYATLSQASRTHAIAAQHGRFYARDRSLCGGMLASAAPSDRGPTARLVFSYTLRHTAACVTLRPSG